MTKKIPRSLFPIALLAGVITGFWGLGWGLPGPLRLRAFPMTMTPQVAQEFSDRWAKLYKEIWKAHKELKDEPETYVHGVEVFPPGWTFPPENLINAYRAMLLQSTNPDEKKSFIILAQMKPEKLVFKPLYIYYGGAFIYPLGAFLKAASLVRAVALVPNMSHYLEFPQDMGGLYWWSRLLMVMFNLGSLWVLYDVGRRLGGEYAGLCAALFFCLCPTAILNSHLIKPHSVASFWFFAGLRYALIAYEEGGRRNYLLSGVCCGLCGGAAFPFAVLGWVPALAWFERRRARRAKPEEMGQAAAACFVAAAVFFATNPYFAMNPLDFRWDLGFYAPKAADRGGHWRGFVSVLEACWSSLGSALAAASVAGLGWSLWKKDRLARLTGVILVGMFAALWVLFGTTYTPGTNGAGIRYYYPLFGVACVLAAYGVTRLPRRWAVLAAAVVLIDTGVRGITYAENMSLGSGAKSNFNLAADWIEANIPAGQSIGLVRYPEPSHTPPFRYDRYRLVVFQHVEMIKPDEMPQWMVMDPEGYFSLKGWDKDRYDIVKLFEPYRLGWAGLDDPNFFANVPVYVLKRKG
ncbi:MAG: glycosyltransferase family 39 protein [Elusimicrobia bacterium]|nr:glycosyltransferase family 39 protein [Elusimicrobiota bacterium]